MEGKLPGSLNLLQLHLAWYPLLQVQDVYKLLYQGILGPEHLMPTRQEFTRQLEAEYESLLPDIKLQLLEPIRADQTLFRLNLRAYKALHQPVKPLISLFLDTSKLSSGSNADLKDTWAAFIDLCMGGKLEGFEISAVQQFSRWLEQEDYPAVHHSEVYHREYRPSYRLIADQFIQSLEAIDAG